MEDILTILNSGWYKVKKDITEEKIIGFAKEQEIMPFIVVGRIQKEENNYKMFYNLKVRYKWE